MLKISRNIQRQLERARKAFENLVGKSFLNPYVHNDDSFKKLILSKSLNHIEAYVAYCFTAVIHIDCALKELEKSIKLLAYKPSGQYLKTIQFSQHDYYLYNLRTFYLQFAAVEDISLLLINQVCEFGLSIKDCKYHILKRSRKLRDTKIVECLVALHKLHETHRHYRNTAIHLGDLYPSEDFRLFSGAVNVVELYESMGIPLDPELAKGQHLYKIVLKNQMRTELCKCAELLIEDYRLLTRLLFHVSKLLAFQKEYKEGALKQLKLSNISKAVNTKKKKKKNHNVVKRANQ